MKILLCLLAFACVAHGYITKVDYTMIKGDKKIVLKQKFILDILRHVYQPLTITEYTVYGNMFVEDQAQYIDFAKVYDFIEMYKNGLLLRNKIFTISDKDHVRQVRGLFNLFYYSKDFVTFKKNVIWARMHVNQEMFVYALYASVIHRTDMTGIILPAIYEILPYKFFTGDVVYEANKVKLTNRFYDDYTYLIYRNMTDMYDYRMNYDAKLRYFTDDIGLNTYYFFLHMDLGFWLGGTDFNFEHTHRGEVFLWTHQQLLARYYLERLSNGLGDIYTFEWDHPIVTGYFPNLHYFNGVVFPMRPNNYNVRTLTKRDDLIKEVKLLEFRLRTVIDNGFFYLDDGTRVDIRDYKGIDYLGKLITGAVDRKFVKFYQTYDVIGRFLLGGSIYNDYKGIAVPSVLDHFETCLRDPVFYQLYKRIINLYWRFKDYLKVYTKDDLYVKFLRINDVNVGKLVTFFDTTDVDITNAVDIKMVNKMDHIFIDKFNRFKNVDIVKDIHKDYSGGVDVNDELWKYLIKFRTTRLNHDPFTVNLDITSEKDVKVVVRTFLGPKFDEFGKMFKLDYNRVNFVELDKFVYDLKTGKNIIRRTSRDFLYTIADTTTYRDIYKRVMTGVETYTTMITDVMDCFRGFPDRLLLPKGRVGGLHMQLFFIVTPLTDVKVADKTVITDNMKTDNFYYDNNTMCRSKTWRFIDGFSLGFPFDRTIVDETFFYNLPNVYFKDVVIFHRYDDARVNYVI